MYRIYRNTYQSLQELADVFTKPLFMIFEKFWQSAHIPGGWKKGNIVPIFSNPRKQDHGNYLLVSLVSVSWEDQEVDPPGSCAKAHVGQDLR